jgi:hypothetical protein
MSERGKITDQHRRRRAVVYVRQSTLHQVERNVESSARQYALRERAIELGWPPESVSVVDEDTGRSAASTAGRIGFKELVAEVGLGHVGLVLALEVSRFARSSADWHQLLDLCALTGTLIADGDGVYSPAEFNDRLLLGLKGPVIRRKLSLGTQSDEGERFAERALTAAATFRQQHAHCSVTSANSSPPTPAATDSPRSPDPAPGTERLLESLRTAGTSPGRPSLMLSSAPFHLRAQPELLPEST